ncbi:MAG: hypothetical protein FJY98_02485 [Candidatus Liptonbacteria bacterium]|nr:hypothetical protein [Candidatus Liptonbacteria bacterium]
MTIEEFLKDPNRRKPVVVIRDDAPNGRSYVDPLFLRYIAADRVEITLPGYEGTGRVVPIDEQAN